MTLAGYQTIEALLFSPRRHTTSPCSALLSISVGLVLSYFVNPCCKRTEH